MSPDSGVSRRCLILGKSFLLRHGGMSALGQKRTYALHQPMSALPPIATAKADFPQTAMSALPPKADMCGANGDVCFGPIADISVNRLLHSHATGMLR